MKEQTKETRLFFFSQSLADGLRITMAVLLPAMIFYYYGDLDTGLIISIGALCASLVDAPGPIIHRKNAIAICLLLIFIVSVITGFARQNIYLLGLEIAVLSFFFSMFTVYGIRATMVANAALLMMALTMDRPILPSEIFLYSLWAGAGSAWYLSISLFAYHLRPYRTAQRVLGESIRELSRYLSVKADFYDTTTDLREDYKKLITQQVVVADKQDTVREILYKTRQIVNETTYQGRKLVLAFIDSVDLFESITASYYDYGLLRKEYGEFQLLKQIHDIAKRLAHELDKTGIAIYTNTSYIKKLDYDLLLIELKKEIDATDAPSDKRLMLKRMLVNIRKIMQAHNDLIRYFDKHFNEGSKRSRDTHALFISHQSLEPKIFWDNFNFSSLAFRHALRVSIACTAGFIISKLIAYGHHSYWILLTISFMLKPAYSLTRQRNIERIIGTLVGGAIGFALLSFSISTQILFGIMVLLMIATYSFQRIKYLLSIICMTPFLLILFYFLGGEFVGVLQERIFDTILGCFIALLAGYILFPDWESENLTVFLRNMLKANVGYLQKILNGLSGKAISTTEYKLARKEVYINLANLSAAFQRMLSEPRNKQKNKNEIHQFTVLNHTLFSNLATVASAVLSRKIQKYPESIVRTARKANGALLTSLEKMGETIENNIHERKEEHKEDTNDNSLLEEQMEFIYKLTADIKKTTEKIITS